MNKFTLPEGFDLNHNLTDKPKIYIYMVSSKYIG